VLQCEQSKQALIMTLLMLKARSVGPMLYSVRPLLHTVQPLFYTLRPLFPGTVAKALLLHHLVVLAEANLLLLEARFLLFLAAHMSEQEHKQIEDVEADR